METQLKNNLGILLQQLENFLTTKTVVGEPIHIDDTILVPLVDVSFGVGAGAVSMSNMRNKTKDKEKSVDGINDTGAGGLGANITPTAVLVIQNGTTQLVNIKTQDSISKLIDMAPGLISKISSSFKSKDNKDKEEDPLNEAYHKMNNEEQ